MFFKRANSVEKQLLNFRIVSLSNCFRNSSLIIICNNLGLSHSKRMKRILNLEKMYFKKHLFANVQQNILSRTMEWLTDATNAFA